MDIEQLKKDVWAKGVTDPAYQEDHDHIFSEAKIVTATIDEHKSVTEFNGEKTDPTSPEVGEGERLDVQE